MPLKYTFTFSPVFQSNYFSFMACSVDKAFNTRIPLVAGLRFRRDLKLFSRSCFVANASRKFTQMRAACVARYLSYLDFRIYINFMVSLQLSSLLKLLTLLVNLSTLDVCKVTETKPEN